MTTSFVGKLAGVTYTDTAAFEKTAKDLGFLPGCVRGKRWKVGTPVRLRMTDGREVDGQVWAPHPTRGYAWVALDDGTFAAVEIHGGNAYRDTNGTFEHIGRTA